MKRRVIIFFLILYAISVAAQFNLIPMPGRVETLRGKFILKNNSVINYADTSLISEAKLLKSLLQPATGFSFQKDNSKSKSMILLKKASKAEKIAIEGYQLEVKTGKIEITASNSAGFFYAFQTLLQLLPAEIYSSVKVENMTWKINGVFIKDEPLLSWRGSMLDVSRQFYEISYLKKYINWLAELKLNVFHLHLTDDEGWRIEIKSFPKLTEIGAWRGPNEALPPAHGSGDKRYGGFYTQDELKDLVKYAAERNIQILPEIDVPGHSKSVSVAYPEILCSGNDTTASVQGVKNNVWCAGREENFEMLDKIIGEVAQIFPMQYIHIGGDEVNHNAWEQCPLCKDLMQKNGYSKSGQLQSYFISRVEKIVEKYGKKMIGWNEILEDSTLHKNSAIMAWTSVEAGMEAIHKQHDVILTPASYFYIDMAQGNGERGHNWATFLPAERLFSFQLPTDSLSKKRVKGIQANLWSEYLDQPAFQTEYQSYPRLCALAELAWSGNKTTFKNFEARLNSKHYDRMYYMGIHFRVPPPAVKLLDGRLKNENNLPHTTVFFTMDGTIPTINSDRLSNKIIPENQTRNTNQFLFRNCYRDSLLSPSVGLVHDTVSFWNNSILNKQNVTLNLPVTINSIDSKLSNTLLFKYLYGSDELAIKRITLFKEATMIFEQINDKPVLIFSRTPVWEVAFPNNIMLEKGKYRIEIQLLGIKPLDSNGIIMLIQR